MWLQPISTVLKTATALPCVNTVSETSLIAARAFAYAAMLLAAGLPLYLLTTGREMAGGRRTMLAIATAAFVSIAASIWWVMESVAAMAALPVSQVDREMLLMILGATPLGTVLAIRSAMLFVAAIAILRQKLGIAAITGSIALATAAWTGHAGATEGAFGNLHRAADIVHLLSAATWLGALTTLLGAVLTRSNRDILLRSLAGFAATGTVLVLLLVGSGIVNMVAIAGWPLELTTSWALLLMAKLGLFAAMLGLAALNRWRLAPALAAGAVGAQRALRLSLAAETAAGFAILLAVAFLGILSPTA